MRLTGEEVAQAFDDTAREQQAGQSIDWERVALRLNERLADNLVDRSRQPEGYGVCRVCKCTDDFACLVEDDEQRSCAWADPEHTLCDNPVCLDTLRGKALAA